MKISLIGTGRVGSTLAFQLLLRGLGEELLLVDRNRKIAEGEALDLQHAEAFTSHPMLVRAAELDDTAESDVIVITCSVPWNQEYTNRFDIGRDNLGLFKQLVPPLAESSPDAKILVITNPVDVMTYHAVVSPHERFPWNKRRLSFPAGSCWKRRDNTGAPPRYGRG